MDIDRQAEHLADEFINGIIGAIERNEARKLKDPAFWYFKRDEQLRIGPRWLRPLRRAQRRYALIRWRSVCKSKGVRCPH